MVNKLLNVGDEKMKSNYIQLMILLASGKHDDHLMWNVEKAYQRKDKEVSGFIEFMRRDDKATFWDVPKEYTY